MKDARLIAEAAQSHGLRCDVAEAGAQCLAHAAAMAAAYYVSFE